MENVFNVDMSTYIHAVLNPRNEVGDDAVDDSALHHALQDDHVGAEPYIRSDHHQADVGLLQAIGPSGAAVR
jgi:hypothetical protein